MRPQSEQPRHIECDYDIIFTVFPPQQHDSQQRRLQRHHMCDRTAVTQVTVGCSET